ncbi:MAG: FIST C-terminal domain-containing protein [Thermoleophilia bacterium]|nr:FIST C-terminal domain-containing protein [Thermoleophilia bacterium]
MRTGQSNSHDPVVAVRELHRQLTRPETELVVFFCSTDYDLDVIAEQMNRAFAGVTVVGCTTAGEIGPLGYLDGSLSGFSLPSSSFAAVVGRIDDLGHLGLGQGEALVHSLLGRLETRALDALERSMFAFQMIDGLSVREESVTRAFQHALGRIPLVGASAGDAGRFVHTYVFSEGSFHENSVVLVLAATSLQFTTFSTLHFAGTDRRAVVTEADPETRTVFEIDALPAAEGYARLFGVDASELGPSFFAAHPVVARVGSADYARAVQNVGADGSLKFYCAIEKGVVLRAAHRGNLAADLEDAFERVRHKLGQPGLVIACDCILRNLEVEQSGLKERVAEVFRRHNAAGFATYGEQLHGLHVNQTLTGIAFGRPGLG